MQTQEMKKHVLQGLEAAGWTAVDDKSLLRPCIAKKDFETAVGVKTALAYVVDTPEACLRVGGEYTSEGCNVLSTTSFYIWYRPRPTTPTTIDVDEHLFKLREEVLPEDLIAGAKAFAEMAEKEISESYAVRLHRHKS
ncbi:hypothetical protein GR140_30485 (plasmid) [Pseudomonas putida]|uniref:hypothetical protein n=1 Tax=Pseudomonas putida TaxID=303 RepID=UPI001BB0CEE8|nr:hypothetical protein [Pseudomonas putida]QUG93096.1 hypothetical protein GR140_30485 [Pseudomonas putida]